MAGLRISDLQLVTARPIKAFCLVFSAWSSLSETLKVAGSINRCYPLTLENMAEGPDVRMTSQPWDQLMWQWWRWVLAEETDLVASEVPFFPTFSVSALTPPNRAILEGRETWRREEKYANTEEKERRRERGKTGQWCWRLSQMLSSAQNSARSLHVKAKLAEWTRTTPGPATLNLAQNSTAVSWTNADAK